MEASERDCRPTGQTEESKPMLTATGPTRTVLVSSSRLAVALAVVLLAFGFRGVETAHAATTFTVNFPDDDDDADFPGGTFDGSSNGKCDVNASLAGRQCTL